VKALRILLVLLLSAALPWSAGAAMLDDLQCPQHGPGGLAGGGMQHDHAAMPPHDVDPDCACAVKCRCQQHCAAVAAAAVLPPPVRLLAFAYGSAAMPGGYAARLPDVRAGSVFRPPIAAPPGAA
jgi:hypothetical protein